MENKVFETQQEFIQYLSSKEGMMKTPSGISSWYWRAKLFYDPNICGCKKKNLNEATIIEGYKTIPMLPEGEKIIARSIVGSNFTLKLNGEVIGTI